MTAPAPDGRLQKQPGVMNRGDTTRGVTTLAPPISVMVASFIVSSIPGDAPDANTLLGFIPPAVQNLLHIPLFALLAWTWCRALAAPHRSPARVIALATAIGIGWSLFDELHQLFVPGRYASLTDMALNLAGLAIGLLVWRIDIGLRG